MIVLALAGNVRTIVPMYIDVVPNRGSRPAVLLREGKREGSRVRKRTLANLSDWPSEQIQALRAVLKGATQVGHVEDAFEIIRTRPHGHVAAVLGTLRKLKLEAVLGPAAPERARVVAMIVARVIHPSSKLATARALASATKLSSLGEVLGVEDDDEETLYQAMDWLLARQPHIESALANRHLEDGTLVLYDVTSTYFEGRHCPLAKLGHSRDGKKGKLQIVFGLLCDRRGCPIAVEVFDGNTGDPTTLSKQIEKLRQRFGIQRVVFVGDRGMLTEARIREELKPNALDWVSALRAPAIRKLVDTGSLQLSLFDSKELAEISDPAFPGERLVVCKNPLLAAERARKRNDLLAATERELDSIVSATRRKKQRLKGKDKIGMRVGKTLQRFKMSKHFEIQIMDSQLHYTRKADSIAGEAALDGIYVVRTSVPSALLDSEQTVAAYKGLSQAERAFRSMKTIDLKVRPIYHRSADRVRAHVLLCMLAYYVEWHMRQALAPMLFDDDDKAAALASRDSVVQPAQRSERARRKARTKHTDGGAPVHAFQTLLDDLATVARNTLLPKAQGATPFECLTTPTPLQHRAFDLLGVTPRP
jgi:transposase